MFLSNGDDTIILVNIVGGDTMVDIIGDLGRTQALAGTWQACRTGHRTTLLFVSHLFNLEMAKLDL